MIINPYVVMKPFENWLKIRNISSKNKMHTTVHICKSGYIDSLTQGAKYILDSESQLETFFLNSIIYVIVELILLSCSLTLSPRGTMGTS